ncbi:hypothetical protein FRC07_001755, partial [Ceratobasidium sp. 392]
MHFFNVIVALGHAASLVNSKLNMWVGTRNYLNPHIPADGHDPTSFIMATHLIDTRPLSSSELKILLALPRAAEATPDALFFKIPRGPDPTLGFVNVSCSEAAAIVSRLAATWETRLADLGLVHNTFWAIGCCAQYVDTVLEPRVRLSLLKEGDPDVLIYYQDNLGELAHEAEEALKIPIIALPEEERAIELATKEKEETRPAPPWPAPRRPTPSVIIHSSSSTSNPKLFRLSLQYWAQNLESHSELITSCGPRTSNETNRTRLLVSSPSWHTFNNILILHLATRAPIAFAEKYDPGSLTSSEILDWMVASEAVQIVLPPLYAREMLRLAFNSDGTTKQEKWANAMKGLDSFGTTGADVDSALSELFVKCNVKAMNLFGTSELGGLLISTCPPYHYLHPYPDIPPPLSIPVSDGASSTNHELLLNTEGCTIVSPPQLVQLWTPASSHPRLAHMVAENSTLVDVEPYPGPGPMHGQPATRWSDLFYELQITRDSTASPEVVYIHAGRTDDFIRLSSNDGVRASEVELALSAAIEAKLDGLGGWELDVVQVFGTNRPHTAAVAQLRRAATVESPSGQVVTSIREAVGDVNKELKLIEKVQMDAYRRVLVVTESGECLSEGSYEESLKGTQPVLHTTHKHTVQRWVNAQTFGPWLDH